MRVIVDAFGGDNAPLEILKGCAMAVQEYGVDIIACGSERVIRDVCEKIKFRSTAFRSLMWKRSSRLRSTRPRSSNHTTTVRWRSD